MELRGLDDATLARIPPPARGSFCEMCADDAAAATVRLVRAGVRESPAVAGLVAGLRDAREARDARAASALTVSLAATAAGLVAAADGADAAAAREAAREAAHRVRTRQANHVAMLELEALMTAGRAAPGGPAGRGGPESGEAPGPP
jgi:hypothetical protein